MTLGERLKEARIYAELKQAEVSARLGINYRTLSGWEHDVSRPNPEDLIALSEIYNTSIDELVGNPHRISQKLTLSKDEEQLVTWYRGLSEDSKALLYLLMSGKFTLGKKPERKMVTA